MAYYWVLLVTSLVIATNTRAHASEYGFKVVYWDSKPFLHNSTTENYNTSNTATEKLEASKPRGILADILSYGAVYCGSYKNFNQFASYAWIAPTNDRFLQMLKSPHSNRNILGPLGFEPNRTIWAPIVVKTDTLKHAIERRGLRPVVFHTSEKVVLIIHREKVGLDFKIAMGLWRCRVVLLTSVIMSLCFGILLWVVESENNPGMHKEFLTGSAKSIWCTFVTMATVGYGDVSPVTFLGRVIMTFWIVMSLFVVGIMTSMISDTVMGDSVFDVANERVAVVRESIAERVVKNNNARVVICKTYEEVYSKVRNGDVFGGMVLNEMVASVQTRLRDDSHPNPLRIVREFSVRHPITMLVPKEPAADVKKNLACMQDWYQQVFKSRSAVNKRHCKIDLIYILSIKESIRQNPFVQTLIGTLLALWIVCFVVEYFQIGKVVVSDRNGGQGQEQKQNKLVHGKTNTFRFEFPASQDETKQLGTGFMDFIRKRSK